MFVSDVKNFCLGFKLYRFLLAFLSDSSYKVKRQGLRLISLGKMQAKCVTLEPTPPQNKHKTKPNFKWSAETCIVNQTKKAISENWQWNYLLLTLEIIELVMFPLESIFPGELWTAQVSSKSFSHPSEAFRLISI